MLAKFFGYALSWSKITLIRKNQFALTKFFLVLHIYEKI